MKTSICQLYYVNIKVDCLLSLFFSSFKDETQSKILPRFKQSLRYVGILFKKTSEHFLWPNFIDKMFWDFRPPWKGWLIGNVACYVDSHISTCIFVGFSGWSSSAYCTVMNLVHFSFGFLYFHCFYLTLDNFWIIQDKSKWW